MIYNIKFGGGSIGIFKIFKVIKNSIVVNFVIIISVIRDDFKVVM